jgi:transposase
LYTILTNKTAKGQKGSIVAIIAGTKAETAIEILRKIPEKLRKKVTEITLDMASNMGLIAKKCFPQATQVTDRSLRRSDPCAKNGDGSRSGHAHQVSMGSAGC